MFSNTLKSKSRKGMKCYRSRKLSNEQVMIQKYFPPLSHAGCSERNKLYHQKAIRRVKVHFSHLQSGHSFLL